MLLNAWISLGIIILIALSLAWSFSEMQRAGRNKALSYEIQRVALDRASHRDYYLRNRTERAKIQWGIASNTLKKLLDSLSESLTDKEDQALLREAQSNFYATVAIFSEIVAIHQKNEAAAKITARDEIESRLSQLYLKYYALQETIEALSESADRAGTRAQNSVTYLALFFILAGIITVAINSSALNRIVTQRLIYINEGLGIISNGNLEHRLIVKGKDELVELSGSINAMTARLQESYQALESEIGQRRFAEKSAQDLNKVLAVKNAQLESANKELESFIYSVSHDLRQPLRAIASFSQIVKKTLHEGLREKEEGYLARVIDNAGRMSDIIEDMLKLSRISRQELKREQIDMTLLAETVVSAIREAQPARCVNITVRKGLTAVADKGLIKTALENLIGNAWKFTAKTENACIEVGGMQRDNKTVYFVRDNGAGFDPEYAKTMFKPFHRLHSENEFEGTGIGLSIVDRIISNHGGEVWAEGGIGCGATFSFTLPYSRFNEPPDHDDPPLLV